MNPRFRYSEVSERTLQTCHPELRRLFRAILLRVDHAIINGLRSHAVQEQLLDEGKSQTRNSRHLPGGGWAPEDPGYPELSYAVHALPWINGAASWDERHLCQFAGWVLATADDMGIGIVWGGDWDRDWDQRDHNLWDAAHYHLDRGIYR